jgi:hypothetical protein
VTRFPADVLCAFDAAFIREPGADTECLDAYSAIQAALYDRGHPGMPLGDFARLLKSLGFKRRWIRARRVGLYEGLAIRPLYAP